MFVIVEYSQSGTGQNHNFKGIFDVFMLLILCYTLIYLTYFSQKKKTHSICGTNA